MGWAAAVPKVRLGGWRAELVGRCGKGGWGRHDGVDFKIELD
jgi:hypothetical protein